MRCKKCGWISFDWLETCGKCGKSMEDEKRAIGSFISDKEPINWFKMDLSAVASEAKDVDTKASDALSEIDVSDLMDSAPEVKAEEIDLEEVELKRIAEDQDFQKALNEIAD